MELDEQEIRVLSPTAILGYGFPLDSFQNGIAKKPHVIAVDAGSSDPGPYYLGSGHSFTDRGAVKRDLEVILTACCSAKIPLIVGSAGGAGANKHLNWCLEIIREIASAHDLNFKLAAIEAEIPKDELLRRFELGDIKELPPGQEIRREDLECSTAVVGQMGLEPFIEALTQGADVIVAGRSYDPSVFACYPIFKGYDPALALHMGKILECACIAATPGSGSDCMMGYLRKDHFCLEPMNEMRKCTTTSVAAHTLYEKSNPYLLPGPGGTLDLRETTFEQVGERIVKVSGSKFIQVRPYTIKIEGASLVGYRTVSIAGARDPIFIKQVNDIIQGVRERVKDNFKNLDGSYHLIFRLYGRNGVMNDLEPLKDSTSHELGIIIEAVAKSQEDANTICSFARSTLLHYGYPNRMSTAGNLAIPYSPSDLKAGEVYRFCVHHLVEVYDPKELFSLNFEQIS
ncbi:hypothetical protein Psfp_01434 [Pelotomaculum sp. FP]|uniref:acyclic terpene utilization AtuA family protein n=1 Tax=Pelotomaculum sp. FP TaxID=261474 RepID=UPI001101752C|nr:acyclic terpene utilization AtuA family protein [Pelotomaculum sp. FP]TEB16409.1 hypothetical protein Psfp_01434 [Pelotomaculum sp. FP]